MMKYKPKKLYGRQSNLQVNVKTKLHLPREPVVRTVVDLNENYGFSVCTVGKLENPEK